MPIITAFQFLTILPSLARRMVSAQVLGWPVGYFPLAGLVLGGIALAVSAFAASLTGDIYGAICEIVELAVLPVWSMQG